MTGERVAVFGEERARELVQGDVLEEQRLGQRRQELLQTLVEDPSLPATMVELSCFSDEGIMAVRNQACDVLLTNRVQSKEKTRRVAGIENRLRVAVPVKRDEVAREAHIPDGVVGRKKYDKDDPDRITLERDIEEAGGGAGFFSFDMQSASRL